MSLKIMFLIISVYISSIFALDDYLKNEIKNIQNMLTEEKIVKNKESAQSPIDNSNNPKTPLLEEGSNRGVFSRASVGSATISHYLYNFRWLIFSGGWYWKSTDEYSSFYYIHQSYEDFSKYGASLMLQIYRISGSPYYMASLGIDLANENNAKIYSNKSLTTFDGHTAYYNSYTYLSSGYTWSVDEWFFSDSGITYSYKIFTLLSDWVKNSTYYNFLRIGFYFKNGVSSQNESTDRTRPSISYFPKPNGSITFSGVPENSELFIYDLSGKLIQRVYGDSWNGRCRFGSKVQSGFYISNIKMPDGEVSVKILKK